MVIRRAVCHSRKDYGTRAVHKECHRAVIRCPCILEARLGSELESVLRHVDRVGSDDEPGIAPHAGLIYDIVECIGVSQIPCIAVFDRRKLRIRLLDIFGEPARVTCSGSEDRCACNIEDTAPAVMARVGSKDRTAA